MCVGVEVGVLGGERENLWGGGLLTSEEECREG